MTDEVLDALSKLQDALRTFIPRARWTRSEGIHLTLKFLGDTDESLIPNIKSELDRIAANYSSFELVLSGVGAFPRLANPRVLWIGLEHSDLLRQLHRDIERVISPLGFPTENRSFKGHLTLARLKGDRWSEESRIHFLKSDNQVNGMILPVDKILLFKSDLKPEGAVYNILHESLFLKGA